MISPSTTIRGIYDNRKEEELLEKISTFKSDTVLAIPKLQGRTETDPYQNETESEDMNNKLDDLGLFRKDP